MKLVAINTEERNNIKVIFDEPINSLDATKHIAGLYRIASGDETISVRRPADIVRADDGRYAIVDGSRRCCLFEMGYLVEESPRPDYYVFRCAATESEREGLIQGLERACSQ